MSLDVTLLGNYDLILGMPWLKRHSGWVGVAGPSLLLSDPVLPSPPLAVSGSVSSHCSSVVSDLPARVLDFSPSTSLPAHLSQFSDVFSPCSSGSLPPHRPGYDCKINLKSGSLPPFSNPYLLSCDEEAELRAYLNDQLARGHIRPSSSPAAAPIFFIKTPGKKNRPCVDYRALNSLTV